MVTVPSDDRPATAWLVRGETVLASIEVCATVRERARGLLGRDGIEGAILLDGGRSVHTFGMRFPIDVALCDRDMRVLKIHRLVANRVTRPVWRARYVIEAEAGAFVSWNLAVGDELRIAAGDDPGSGARSPTPSIAVPSVRSRDRDHDRVRSRGRGRRRDEGSAGLLVPLGR